MSFIDTARIRRKYFSKRFTLQSTDVDKDTNASYLLFQSDKPGSPNFSSERGHRNGVRFNIRIKPESDAVWVKLNSVDNDPIYVAGDEVLEEFNVQSSNVFITSAVGTVAQVQVVDAVADVSQSLNNTYWKLHAADPVQGEYTYGIWYDVDSNGVQPVDGTVDEWAEVDISEDDTATAVATATELVLEALTLPDGAAGDAFTTSSAAEAITITHNTANAVRSAQSATSGFTVDAPSTPGEGTDTVVNILVK